VADVIAPDVLQRLPPAAQSKLLLLDGLSDELLARADSAQAQLRNLARRRYPGVEDDPSVPRLGAVVADAEHRREELFRLVGACVQWVRSIPEHALPLEAVAVDVSPRNNGESADGSARSSPEEAVMKIRAEIGELTLERMEVAQLPEPRPIIMAAFRAEVARLAAAARPALSFERGRARPLFQHPDFIGPEFVAGLLSWLFPDKMTERLDEMVAAEIDDMAAMASDEQERELARLDGEIEALGRQKEALIEAAFARGVDVLRRANASPQAVLGVRLRPVVAARPMRRPRPARPVAEAAE
jgi:hypothetical protein